MKKVVVAMSGGVDSSLAAALLKEEGYEVIGVSMRLFCYHNSKLHEKSCCSFEAIEGARAVCDKLKIPHYVIDLSFEFERVVIENFCQEYLKGKTPNPCIVCNTVIKFSKVLEKAKSWGADFLATGHYARIVHPVRDLLLRNEAFSNGVKNGEQYRLFKGVDRSKDQSYALWGLTQKTMSNILFPLGNLTKEEVRNKARKLGLKTANKAESQEICFIPDNNYGEFLRSRGGKFNAPTHPVSPGQIVDKSGKILGEHKGIAFYTIGQRSGLGIAIGKPLYVIRIDGEKNQIYVGEDKDLYQNKLIASQLNWLRGVGPRNSFQAEVKIRYLHPATLATITPLAKDKVSVVFAEPQRAITPGQSVVFYRGEEVIGGGIIESKK